MLSASTRQIPAWLFMLVSRLLAGSSIRILKKPSLDTTNIRSYQPISQWCQNCRYGSSHSNWSVAWWPQIFYDNISQHTDLPFHNRQLFCTYWPMSWTQHAKRGDVSALIMLDLSAAFDIVDHDILLRRLMLSYGVTANAQRWFWSYLNGQTQHVHLG